MILSFPIKVTKNPYKKKKQQHYLCWRTTGKYVIIPWKREVINFILSQDSYAWMHAIIFAIQTQIILLIDIARYGV